MTTVFGTAPGIQPIRVPVWGWIPRPGVHGGDADAIAAYLGVDASEILDLSASLNPVAPDVDGVIRKRRLH